MVLSVNAIFFIFIDSDVCKFVVNMDKTCLQNVDRITLQNIIMLITLSVRNYKIIFLGKKAAVI